MTATPTPRTLQSVIAKLKEAQRMTWHSGPFGHCACNQRERDELLSEALELLEADALAALSVSEGPQERSAALQRENDALKTQIREGADRGSCDGQRATASSAGESIVPKPYLWVSPNPAGIARQLMTFAEAFEFIGDIPQYAADGESVAVTLVHLTDAEVEALPSV